MTSSQTNSYSLEFWHNIFTYLTDTSPFSYFEVIWNNHNKIELFNESPHTLKTKCYPVYSTSDSLFNSSINKNADSEYNSWQHVSCGVDLNLGIYSINSLDSNSISSSSLNKNDYTELIMTGGGVYNFGYLFIKNIKLWSSSFLRLINADCL